MNYYIWANGEEHGPYDFDQLYGSWKDGSAPEGFLWRRENEKTFSHPDSLTVEYEGINAPRPNPPSPSQRPTFHLKIGTGAGTIGTLLIILGLALSGSPGSAGGALVAFGMAVFFSGWCDAVLRGLAEIIRQLDELNHRADSGGK